MRGVRQRDGNVPSAENVQHGLRQDRLDKNLKRAAANQAVVVVGLVVQAESHLARRFGLHHFLRGARLRLRRILRQSSRNRAVFANEHPRALIARNRAIRVKRLVASAPRFPARRSFTTSSKEVHRKRLENRAWALLGAHMN